MSLFSGVSIFRGLDYASTRNMQARGREEILLPDDVVNNSAGFASVEAAASATSVGLSYWMHRTGSSQTGALGFHRSHQRYRVRRRSQLCSEV